MRAAQASETIAGMDPEQTIRIGLEIRSRAPMRGLLCTEDGRVREFEGWLQLISALSDPGTVDAVDPEIAREER